MIPTSSLRVPFVHAYDTETALSRPGMQAPELACLIVSTLEAPSHTDPPNQRPPSLQLFDRREAHLRWRGLLQSAIISGSILVGSHMPYDMAVMVANSDRPLEDLKHVFEAYHLGRVADVAGRQRLLDIADGTYSLNVKIEGYNLGAIGRRLNLANLDKESPWRQRFGELIDVPLERWPREAIEYVTGDGTVTLAAYFEQHRIAMNEGNPAALPGEDLHRPIQNETHRAAADFTLHLIKLWGLRTDPEGMRRLKEAAEKELKELDWGELDEHGRRLWDDPNYRRQFQELHAPPGAIVPHGVKPWPESEIPLVDAGLIRGPAAKSKAGSRDTKAAASLLARAYAEKGQEIPKTDSDNVSLARESCEKSGARVFFKYARRSQLTSVLSKDVPMLERGIEMPIHTRWGVAETLRSTSSDPNVQNWGRDGGSRECVVPRQGFGIAACDYSGIELRTFGQVLVKLVGYSKLADALNGGLDPHLEIASRICGRPYAELEHSKHEKWVKQLRQTGKVANFGFPGGLGAATLVYYAWQSYHVKLTEPEAKELKTHWRGAWDEVNHYFRIISDVVDNGIPIMHLPEGVGHIRGGCGYTDACNSLFQSLAAQITQKAGFLLAEACYLGTVNGVKTWASEALFGCRIINYVHDEFLIEYPLGRAHAVTAAMRAIMVDAARPYLPDLEKSIEVEFAAMHRWSKDASAVYFDGRRYVEKPHEGFTLVEWTPEIGAWLAEEKKRAARAA